MGLTPEILVIGGGATGTAIARDLSMRGFDVTLFEKEGLANGATGRMHGLLHSGARYADSDPESAQACIQENEVLRGIAGHCLTDTSGLFVSHPSDPDGYLDEKKRACEEHAIPVERLDGDEAREREPGLSEETEAALAVPDAAVDPCRLVAATALSAEHHGATIDTNVTVSGFLRADGAINGALAFKSDGAAMGTPFEADYVVNAAGAWAGALAGNAGIDLDLRQSQGALAVVDADPVSTVVNRCRPRDEGDIVVPHGSQVVIGATDVEIDSPGAVAESDEEVRALVEELSVVVPAISDATVSDSYWGVRPLFAPETDGTTTGAVTRGFSLIDHEQRDDTWGLTTVVGGKFTTHRLMAERVADHVCQKFGIERGCRTDEEPLPGAGDDEKLAADVFERYGIDSPMRTLQ
jgi:glycerol-3-phosphate dehydrogenase